MQPEDLRNYAASIGVDRVGWFAARDFPGYLEALAQRPEYDFAYRDRRAFEEASRLAGKWRTIVVILADYFMEDAAALPGYKLSNYSRFCWSTLNPLAQQVMKFLFAHGHQAGLVNAPDRSAACAAGLGVIGKNCMFYADGLGSYVGIRTLGTDWEAGSSGSGQERTPAPHCEHCQRCIRACPVGAIYPAGFRIDPLRCISFLNRHSEEPKFRLPEDPRSLRGWVHGCEICQEVCPMNAGVAHPRRTAAPPEMDIYGVKLPNTAQLEQEQVKWAASAATCPGYTEYLTCLLKNS